MTIEYREGDLFKQTDLEALAHGCNMRGAMGAGIAKTFRDLYPDMYEQYRVQCQSGMVQRGNTPLFLWKTMNGRYIFNLFTQEDPGPNASIWMVDEALHHMLNVADRLGIESIGMPEIGCGIGGLKWDQVEASIEDRLRYRDAPSPRIVVVRYKP